MLLCACAEYFVRTYFNCFIKKHFNPFFVVVVSKSNCVGCCLYSKKIHFQFLKKMEEIFVHVLIRFPILQFSRQVEIRCLSLYSILLSFFFFRIWYQLQVQKMFFRSLFFFVISLNFTPCRSSFAGISNVLTPSGILELAYAPVGIRVKTAFGYEPILGFLTKSRTFFPHSLF